MSFMDDENDNNMPSDEISMEDFFKQQGDGIKQDKVEIYKKEEKHCKTLQLGSFFIQLGLGNPLQKMDFTFSSCFYFYCSAVWTYCMLSIKYFGWYQGE